MRIIQNIENNDFTTLLIIDLPRDRWKDGNFYYYSSTEQLVKGGTDWTETEKSLPARIVGPGSITLDNQIFTIGKANILNKVLFIY